jgi:osmoprotectant transport system substrate-binding protein
MIHDPTSHTHKRRTPAMRRSMKITALVVAGALALGACGSDDDSGSDTTAASATTGDGGSAAQTLEGTEITVGSSNFDENVLLAEMYAQALEAQGAAVSKKFNIGSREVVFPAISEGEISLLPEYTNSLLSFVLAESGESPTATNVEEQVAALKEALPDNLTVLTPSSAEDKDVIVCTPDVAEEYGLVTLSDLGENAPNIVLGAPPEFQTRTPFGIPGFKETYGAEFKEFRPLEIGQPIVDALKGGAIDCGNLFSTDPAVESNGFVALEDDKVIVPNEAVLLLIATDLATPEVQAVLDKISSTLDTDALVALMVRVRTNAEDPAQLATDWLSENGLS